MHSKVLLIIAMFDWLITAPIYVKLPVSTTKLRFQFSSALKNHKGNNLFLKREEKLGLISFQSLSFETSLQLFD